MRLLTILFKFFLPFRNARDKALKLEIDRVLEQNQEKILKIQAEGERALSVLEKKKAEARASEAELDSLIKRNEDRKYDLKKANEELQTNIRLTIS